MFWSESGEKSASDQAAFTRQNSSKLICGWILMRETTGDALFHWRKRYYGLWTHILVGSNGLKLKTTWWICFSFCLLQMLTDGLECCGLLWCFYQLFGLSFWRHPFTAEHPLLRHWCRDTFLQTWWRNKLILILDGLRVNTFLANFHFEWTIPLKEYKFCHHMIFWLVFCGTNIDRIVVLHGLFF